MEENIFSNNMPDKGLIFKKNLIQFIKNKQPD